MKEAILIYQGYMNNLYCFISDSGKEFRFVRANNELIHNYQLLSNNSVGLHFKARYFINEEKYLDKFILCDLENI